MPATSTTLRGLIQALGSAIQHLCQRAKAFRELARSRLIARSHGHMLRAA